MITDRLDRFINNERVQDFRQYSPAPIGRILAHFGDPHLAVPCIHVAGTNGKGSVAHMLNGIFTEAGYTAGLYTSPHLRTVNERIMVRGVPISDSDLSALIDAIVDFAGSDPSNSPTYFDLLTACAFRYFHQRGVDIAIIETGLGGRLDSTNVVVPLCSVITDISMDHAHILGGTLPAIAREKAGIIKTGVPAVTSNLDPDVITVLDEEAISKNAPLLRLSRDFSAGNITRFDQSIRFDYSFLSGQRHDMKGVEVNHPLGKQAANSSCAITACLLVRGRFPLLTDAPIRAALKRFSAPGRFQKLCRDPLIIFDPAHNVAAMREMAALVAALHPGRSITTVLTLMKDKDIEGIIAVLEEFGMAAIYFSLDDPRCYRPAPGSHSRVLHEIIHADEARLAAALDARIGAESLIFFTGSFRLYGAALNYAGRHPLKCT